MKTNLTTIRIKTAKYPSGFAMSMTVIAQRLMKNFRKQRYLQLTDFFQK
ncbi:hypothetical protein LJC72_12850 [Bacteroides sp. OttesenSCG-928-D19]|nr:hypothetical protein [Bacteroides sp. OttesenSCG-928-D19]